MSALFARPAAGTRAALLGTLVHAPTFGALDVVLRGALVYDERGVITDVLDQAKETKELKELLSADPKVGLVVDYGNRLITPGLIDAHCHAPQYVFTGTGMDLPLLQWLNKYTFPCESRFQDLEFARQAYSKAVSRHVSFGTTFCSYFGTIHAAAADLLVDIVETTGQRAFVGKVSMDRNSPDFYIEETARGIADAEGFCRRTLARSEAGKAFLAQAEAEADAGAQQPATKFSLARSLLNSPQVPLVLPCVTPRFVPTCSVPMLTQLGALSAKYGLPLQSHLSESQGEIAWVRDLHPECSSYGDVYDR